MTELELESDAFLMLLTDALRSGPGSPSWHEALQKLRAGGINDGDEYRLLVKAREHLESGREYRSIRAGPEFAKRLMSTIEQDASSNNAHRPPASAMVAVASAAVMLVVLLVIGYLLWNAAEYGSGDGSMRLLPNVVTQVEFETGVPLPADWHTVGRLGLDLSQRTMRPVLLPRSLRTSGPSGSGGGIFWDTPISPSEPFSVSVNVRVRQHLEENLMAQVVVTDDPQFSPENGTTPHEFVWLLEGRRVQVISPSLRVESPMMLGANYADRFMPLLITIDRDQATIDLDNKRIWFGPNGLDPEKSRYVGLRFLRQTNDAGDQVVFQSLRVNMRQK